MYFMAGQRNIRKDLIAKELEKVREPVEWKVAKCPSNRFMDWLYRHYYVDEFAEMWYDDEPENITDEMSDSERYRVLRDNEERRMTFNNWIDLMGEGIWVMSQHEVDKKKKRLMKSLRGRPVKKKGRIYMGKGKNSYYIYWYGRDFEGLDMWWSMKKRGTAKK